MKIEKFEDIKSWKKARELVKLIYGITKDGMFSKDFGLRDQIQRASVSIMSNIAEGFDSGTQKSFINFLNYSYRSTSEVQSLLYVASDLNYITQEQFVDLYNRSKEIKKLIGGFIQYLATTTN
ncbi:MAG: four helix bundle protein [Ignavibacterium sp.]|nr:MAG: four helix bundle protein [Ignavibacterium sp.]